MKNIPTTLSKKEIEMLRGLKDRGYAVVLFNAVELEGADADEVEDRMIAHGWEVIQEIKPEVLED